MAPIEQARPVEKQGAAAPPPESQALAGVRAEAFGPPDSTAAREKEKKESPNSGDTADGAAKKSDAAPDVQKMLNGFEIEDPNKEAAGKEKSDKTKIADEPSKPNPDRFEPKRDDAGRVSGHRANFGKEDALSIRYTDEKSKTVDSVDFSSSHKISRNEDGSYSETTFDSKTTKLKSVDVDQDTGAVKLTRAEGDSLTIRPGGAREHANESGKVDFRSTADGRMFSIDAGGKQTEIASPSHDSFASIHSSARIGGDGPPKPHIEKKANGDIVESHSPYGDESYTVTKKPDGTRITDVISAGTRQTNYPDGKITKDFSSNALGLKQITWDTNGDVTKDYANRSDHMTQTVEKHNADGKVTQRETSFSGSGLQKRIEFGNDDKQKRDMVREYDNKTVTDFRDGQPARSITEYKNDREDGVTKVVELPNREREVYTKDGKMTKDGIEKEVPLTDEDKKREGISRVSERNWAKLETSLPGVPGERPADSTERTSEFKGREDGMVREIDVSNHRIVPGLTKVQDFEGRKDGLQRSAFFDDAHGPERSDIYDDREVLTYKPTSDLREITHAINPAEGQMTHQMKFANGSTLTHYKGKESTFVDKDGKPIH